MPDAGQKAIDFCLKDFEEKEHCLLDFKGKWIVLYFYPKDNTSGCTKEAVGFSEHIDKFKKFDCEIIGISPDTPKKHKNFIEKYDLKILLLSDPEHKVLEDYEVWKKKKMYGREYFGVLRTTYLINPDFDISYVWRNVRVKGHIDDVLDQLDDLYKK